jgi:hypothetical protein
MTVSKKRGRPKLKPGASGKSGWTLSDKTRQRMSTSRKGKPLSEKTKAKLRAAAKLRSKLVKLGLAAMAEKGASR